MLGLVIGIIFVSGLGDALIPDLDLDLTGIEVIGPWLTATAAGVVSTFQDLLPDFIMSQENPDTLLEEGEAAAVLGSDELLMTSAAVIGQRVGVAGAFGAAGALGGLLADTAKEPILEKEGDDYMEISKFTPGTVKRDPDTEDRPLSALQLGMKNFNFELKQLLRAARIGGKLPRRNVPGFVPSLVLSNQAVIDRERARPEVPTPGPVRVAYDVLCWFIDVVFEDRPIQRFWFLETVARMPYFAYMSVLHLYETFGWWRSPELRAVHAAEEDNELHHLLIMESLGGDQRWLDRFFAQHGAFAYYWILVSFFVIDPRWSYNFSRLIEAHAVDTYGEFVDANEEELKRLPPPPIAVEYYLSGEWYLFDKFQTALRQKGEVRRPPCATLYDVFKNICDDEGQHVLTMEACEKWANGADPAVPLGFNTMTDEEVEKLVCGTDEGRKAWESWGQEVTRAAKEAARVQV